MWNVFLSIMQVYWSMSPLVIPLGYAGMHTLNALQLMVALQR